MGSSILEASQIVTNCTATYVSIVATSHSDSASSSCVLPTDIAPSTACFPVYPVRIKFLTTKFGSTSRCFNPAWYDKQSWLEYSVQHDACYCYPCRMFSANASGSSRPQPVFTSTAKMEV